MKKLLSILIICLFLTAACGKDEPQLTKEQQTLLTAKNYAEAISTLWAIYASIEHPFTDTIASLDKLFAESAKEAYEIVSVEDTTDYKENKREGESNICLYQKIDSFSANYYVKPIREKGYVAENTFTLYNSKDCSGESFITLTVKMPTKITSTVPELSFAPGDEALGNEINDYLGH